MAVENSYTKPWDVRLFLLDPSGHDPNLTRAPHFNLQVMNLMGLCRGGNIPHTL